MALAVTASVAITSLAVGAVTLPSAQASAGSHSGYSGPLGTIHPVQAITVADTMTGLGLARHPLAGGGAATVHVAALRGVPATATSVTLAALVTRSSGSGQIRVGATKATSIPAVATTKGQQSTASFTTLLGPAGTLSLSYAGSGRVDVRLVVEAFSTTDLTGSSLHLVTPVRVADTWTGRGLPKHPLRKHGAAQVQIAGAAGIPAQASAVLLALSDNSAGGTGAITVGPTAGRAAPVVTFSRGRQATGSVITPLSSNGRLTVVNASTGRVGLTADVLGYYTRDTTGLLFQALPPRRFVDTRTGLNVAKKPLAANGITAAVRSEGRLPRGASAAVLNVVVPAPGQATVSAGATARSLSTILLTSPGVTAMTATTVPLSPSGSVVVRATGRPVQVQLVVLGYYAPLPVSAAQGPPPTSAPPTTTPPATSPRTPPPTTTPPTTTPPTTSPTTPPPVVHPRVLHVDPGNGAIGVDPTTTSVVTDLVLPNGGVMAGSLNAATVTLVATGSGVQVPAHYGTSGGADTINVSPTAPLDPNTQYRFTVTDGATDVQGVSFVPFTSTFTTGPVLTPDNNIAFDHYDSGASGQSFASLTKGPDGKLYASTLDGWIFRYDIAADGSLTNPQPISTVRDHAVAAGLYGAPARTIIGLAFDPASTAANLKLWITDNSAYVGQAPTGDGTIPDFSDHVALLSGHDLETYTDVVSGLPRSVKDHESNSLAFGPDGALYLSQGANNAMGQADSTWGNRDEHLLNAAVLRLDLNRLPASLPLDVQTDETATPYDPYAATAALTIYATGLRNAFDLVWHSNGHLYAPTNGSAAYGSAPASPISPSASCVHRPDHPTVPAAAPAELFNPVAETDFLFDVKHGKYYGHPDPARCEYTLDGGNPTAGTDPYEVAAYPVGTQPDPNYDVNDVYDAGLHASADGEIEYHGSAFNGSLDHRLLVVRYSDGQDIETFDVAGSGALSNRTVGIKGFTGFQSPLDLTEDNATGNIYVSELGTGSIELLRPRGINPAAMLTVTNGDTIPSNSRMIFSRIQSPVSGQLSRDGITLTLSAPGGAGVTVSALNVTGPFQIDSKPALPKTIAAGGHLNIVVRFTATSGAVSNGTLTIQTNASGVSTRTIQLAGFFQSASGTGEPTAHDLAGMMGWTTNVPLSLNNHGRVQADGAEVLAPSFTRVDPTQPVTVRQIAEFAGYPSSSTFAYYDPATPGTATAVFSSNSVWAESVLPASSTGSLPGAGSFLPTSSRFGLRIDGESSDDTLNGTAGDVAAGCTGPCGHHVRVFPVKDGNGNLVQGSYFVVVDQSGPAQDDDFNDATYLVANVQP